MANKMICFDMDGTIADLYGVENWEPKLRAEDATPYIDALPMWDMDKLGNVLCKLMLEGWEIRVITWLSKNASEEYKKAVRIAKTEWLAKYNFPYHRANMIQYGRTKMDCVRGKGTPLILIDDNDKVRNGWTGETIDPTTQNIIEELEKLLVA